MDYQQNTGSNRPFSTTNPFRTAGLGEQSPQPGHYNSTWNSFDSQPVPEQIPLYSSNNPVSFNDSVNPPRPTMARRKSTNPFLDDSELIPQEPIYSSQQQSYHQASPSPPPPKSRNQQHMSAKEEKEQLRQRYMKEADVGNNNSNNRNMSPPPMASLGSALPPPSYEESTEYKSTSKPIYPVEKQRESSGEAVTRHRTHSSSSQPHRRHQQHGDDQYDDEYDNSHRPHRHHSGNERSHRHHHNSSHSNRHREGSTSSGSNKTKKDKRKSMAVISKNVDTIDKLDVTGLFGGSFHHDGPFDACTPHRNKNNKAAPVAAFPADGPKIGRAHV